MKKYFQITFFLGLFFMLVFIRRMTGGDDTPVVGNKIVVVSPSSTSTPTPTQDVSQPTTTAQPPTSTPTSAPAGQYKDGTYTGSVEDAYYGNYQVQVTIAGGKISDIAFLQYPNDNPTSQFINQQAMPQLKQEAIQAQSANVDIVSGASDSSAAFQKSLGNALQQAKS